MEQLNFDTIILGGGPAGLSAAIYAARGAVSTAIIDLNMLGGQPSNYLELENYLKQHIKQIEHKKGKQGLQINFRDPKYGTHKYYFTLANNDTVFYKKNVKQDDEFQIAYHRGIAYRENCYFHLQQGFCLL